MKTARVVVVGGGVIGLCSAYYALKRGFAVTVVERGLLMLCNTAKGLAEEIEVAESAREIGLCADVLDAAVCSIFAEAKLAITPLGSGLRFGGTMEVGGLNLDVSAMRVQGIVRAVRAYFPKFAESDFAGVKPWVGLRPVSPDGIPYTGVVKGLENLVVNCGHAMMGLSLAPVSGRLAADLLAGDTPFRPIEALAPGRF